MVDSVSSLIASNLSSFGGIFATTTATSAATSTSATAFGPDYLLSALDAQTSAATGTYDSSGTVVLPPADSPAGQKRAAAIQEASDLLTSGDTAGARAKAQTVLAGNPGDPTANYIMGRAYMKDGDYQRAETFWSRVAASSPDNAQAQSDLRAAQTLQHGEAAAVAETKRLLANPSTVDEGLRLAGYMIETKPDNVDARIALADYYDSQGALDQAGNTLSDALDKAAPERQAKLLTRLEQFASDHADQAGAHDLLARAYAAAGKLAEAEKEFNTAVDMTAADPASQQLVESEFSDVYTQMGHQALQSGDTTTAARYFDKALDLNNDDARRADVVDVNLQLGEKAVREGIVNVALRSLSKASTNLTLADEGDRRERLTRAYNLLASKLVAAGDLKRAVSARQGTYDLDTKDETAKRSLADAHDAYGMQLMDAGKYRDALKEFKAALKLYSDDATYGHHQGLAQSHL